MVALPLGAGLVAAAARRAGHEVHFLDLLVCDQPLEAVREAVEGFRPEVIGVSVRNIDNQSLDSPRFLLAQVEPVIATCRALTNVPIILGGPGFSVFPEDVLRFLGADLGIVGEGEEAFVELLRRFTHNEDLSGIRGLQTHAGSWPAIHHGNLAEFPFWDEALTASARSGGSDLWIPIQTRRGCPNNCSYCSTAAIQGRVIRTRPVDAVVAEIRRLAELQLRRLYFVDNSFNIPESYALSLCRAMEAASLDVEWRCILYPQHVTEELVSALAKAGCVEVSLGFESGNREVLREMNKRYTPDDVRQACDVLASDRIRVTGFLLLGGPGENRTTVEESLTFAESLPLNALRTTIGIRIYPHTALANRAVADGVISESDSLLFPRFYLAAGLDPWIYERVSGNVRDADETTDAK